MEFINCKTFASRKTIYKSRERKENRKKLKKIQQQMKTSNFEEQPTQQQQMNKIANKLNNFSLNKRQKTTTQSITNEINVEGCMASRKAAKQMINK